MSNRWPVLPMPSADEVACAVVAACRYTGEDPVICVSSTGRRVRARYLAAALLRERHPSLSPKRIGPLVGFGSLENNPLSPSRQPKYVDPGSFGACRPAFEALLARYAPVACDRLPVVAPSPRPTYPAPPVRNSSPRPPIEARDLVPLDRTVGRFAVEIAGKADLRDMLAQALANTPGARKA